MKKNNKKFEELKFTSSKTKNLPKNKKVNYKFELKIVLSIIIIIFLIIITGLSMYIISSLMNNSEDEKESGLVTYQVCNNNGNCNSNISINNLKDIKEIYVNYNYNYNSSLKNIYNINYWIDDTINIFDSNNEEYNEYFNSNRLVNKENISLLDNDININKDLIVDLNYYYSIYKDYINNNKTSNPICIVKVTMYLENNGIISNVGDLVINFDNDEISIYTENTEEDILVNNVNINNYIVILFIICIISIIVSLLIIIKVTNNIIKTIDKNNKCINNINEILDRYRNDIILSRKEYNYDDFIKVYSFEELMILRKKLDTKIRFYKINEYKYIFIIEDKDKVYRYLYKN